MIILTRGITSLKKLSWNNSRNLSFFPISNFKTQNSPYQVKAKHRAGKPLFDRDRWRNTVGADLLLKGSLCRPAIYFIQETHLNHPEQKRVAPDHDTEPLLWGINPRLCLSESHTHLAQRTQLMCWLSENRNFCLWTVHTLTVLSSEAVTKDWPSLEKWTLLTVAVWALNTVDSPLLHKREELFKIAQQGSKDILYLQTHSCCRLSSARNPSSMGTACDHIRIKTLTNPKLAHASWAIENTQLKPVVPVPYWRPIQQ